MCCSANSDNEVSLDELLAYFGPVGLWLEAQLTPIIGLEKLKSQIRGFYRSVALDQKRIEAGHAISKGSQYHMIFRGNPGTGKTTMGRMMASLMNKLGVIPEPSLKVRYPSLWSAFLCLFVMVGIDQLNVKKPLL